eukprot:scaffold12244_cov216-Isochrysis_galbana.AAC.11
MSCEQTFSFSISLRVSVSVAGGWEERFWELSAISGHPRRCLRPDFPPNPLLLNRRSVLF